jgi:hypothetical protein
MATVFLSDSRMISQEQNAFYIKGYFVPIKAHQKQAMKGDPLALFSA